MAEILLCVHDRSVTGNMALDNSQPKQGDVIAALPDGWGWSELELGGPTWFNTANGKRESVSTHPNGNHSFFRIIKLPNVSLPNARSMLAQQLPVDPLNPSPFLFFRNFFLDKTLIPPATMQALIDNWNDNGRANGFLSVNYTAAQIVTIRNARPVVPWP